MNAKEVLNKMLTLLSLADNSVALTDARLKDGTIVQSPTFDVGETADIVGEDGKLSPAPDGEHELELKDSEGNEVRIKIIVKDGKIEERENVELEDMLPEMEDEEDDAEIEIEMAEATTEEVKGLPNTTDESPSNEIKEEETDSPIISELKSKIKELETELEAYKMAAELPSDELPKLDGAPIDESMNSHKMSAVKKSINKNVERDPQAMFLSKLYK